MSRGLGVTQRRLLSALYAAPGRQLLRWDIAAAERWATPRGRWREDRADGTEFYVIVQLGLAELHHPTLRETSRRSAELYKVQISNTALSAAGLYTVADWYSLNEPATSSAERDQLRSWRAAYRQATRGLSGRGLIDSAYARVDLEGLGQQTFGGTYGGAEPPRREVLLARITDLGRDYVHRRRVELVADPSTVADDLRRALRAAGFLDIAEPKDRPAPPYRRRRVVATTQRASVAAVAAPEPRPQSGKRPGCDEVIALLVSEGFAAEQLRSVLREWHRAEQRMWREQFDDYGIPLEEREFDADDIDELRRRLTG
ncbi:hypothetical protein [Nocardia brasiliensis]|uniref:hypothetical protein n=1 Tax=Nocardia brasiliensis TaxID=37326 RepID=UPI0024547869|nr:hypothetical protein [Nocardia brasiliensis]